MKIPDASHPISIETAPTQVKVVHRGQVIADSARALLLREANYPPVYYIPRADVMMAHLTRTDHATHCPFKGDASYFTITIDGQSTANAVWSYETPYPAMAEIKEHLAFDSRKVDAIEASETAA